jgi:hypothetical protein
MLNFGMALELHQLVFGGLGDAKSLYGIFHNFTLGLVRLPILYQIRLLKLGHLN